MGIGSEKIVVIGAGVGGLSAAMRLAHAGLDVTVLETHKGPGGKMRTVDTTAGPADAGPTVLTMRWVFDELFDSVGARLDDYVTLRRQLVLARHWWPDGSRLDLLDDPEANAAEVRRFAGPRAERDFRRFCSTAERLFRAFDVPVMQSSAPGLPPLARYVARRPGLVPAMAPFSTMSRRLAQEFRDPRLRQLFGRYATYVGGSPYLSPAILRLVWHAEAQGVWCVDGGMHGLARAMAEVAEARGAALRYETTARRIEFQSGHVVAVHVLDGGRIQCDRAVFNGDPRALSTGLLGDGCREAVPDKAVEPRSLSANVWTFSAEAKGVELAHHNVFFGADPRREFEPIAAGNLPEDPTLYVCAQDRGTDRNPSGNERFEIIMNAPPLADGVASEDIASCRTRTFPVLADRGLRFSPEPPDSALTTPSGFDRLFPASQGSLYGRSPHGLTAAFARPTARTPLHGLYLAGSGAHPGAGIPMATLSGRHAAEAILTDQTSTSRSRPTAMRGGMSTGSAIAVPAPSRSSPS